MRLEKANLAFSFILLLATTMACGQGSSSSAPAKGGEGPSQCRLGSLPADVQDRLRAEYGSWRIQEPSNLSPRARERWESEKPMGCPGMAVGQFEGPEHSYALLLVPMDRPGTAYRLLVFSHKKSAPSFELSVLEQSDDGGAGNAFIRSVPIAKFFDHESKKKFDVKTEDGILFIYSAEKEYEAQVYFWARGKYRNEPVDY